jgi:hypothetical protein
MLRILIALTALFLMADQGLAQTLAPGKPAGVGQAQHITYGQAFIGISAIAVALVYILPAQSTTSTSTVSTATTS